MTLGTGYGRSYGAITVVNAIATGRGAAIGIDLHTDAQVTLKPTPDGTTTVDVRIEDDRAEDPSLARHAVTKTLERLGVDTPVAATVTTSSTIPTSRGLKSSSAAANAIVLATVAACGKSVGEGPGHALSDLDAVRLGVDAALAAGVTITGAFDDAAACYFGGLVCTDNPDRSILHQEDLGDLEVLLVIPSTKVKTRDTATNPTHPLRPLLKEAHSLACRGEWKEAMLRNSLAYGGSYGLSNQLVLAMLDTGAIAAGISGTGPAQAVVIRRDDWDCFTGIIGMRIPDARVLVAHTNRTKATASTRALPEAPAPLVVQEGTPEVAA